MSIKFLSYQLGENVTLTREETLEGIREQFERDCGVYRRYDGVYCIRQMYSAPKIPKEFACDREFMLEAVQINGATLKSASANLQRDKELILLAAENCDKFHLDVPQEYFEDRDFALKLLAVNGAFLSFYKKFDKEVILTAVKNDYEAAEYIEMLDWNAMRNRDFVLELADANGRTLRFADKAYKDDEEIVLRAAKSSYRAFEFASERLRNDEEFLSKVLDVNPACLAYAPRYFRENKELVRQLMERNAYVYRYAQG